ncbi:MAG: METTL5 family protein [Candidatus Hodarchaeales archaeon]|jgi:predicted RNA methylase
MTDKQFTNFFHSLPDFTDSNVRLEQYSTPLSFLNNYINLLPEENFALIDLGCGTGRLGLTATQYGATQVIGIDIDKEALNIAQNFSKIQNLFCTWIHSAVEFFPLSGFKGKIDGVIMNPPFGTRRQNIDFVFLRKAFETSGWVISLHKNHPQTIKSLERLVRRENYQIASMQELEFPLSSTFPDHKFPYYPVQVILCLFILKT